jgi:hypothetical protein
MAVSLDKRVKEAVKVQQVLTKHGCIINLRVGLHETANVCSDRGLILLSLCGTRKEVAALKAALLRVRGVRVRMMTV